MRFVTPIHIFIHFDSDERRVLDSRPFQQLRNIHQLALSYLVYPGATHKRFEHCLGVMELAGRVFDIVTHEDAVTDEIRKLIPEITQKDKKAYWRRVLRMAALCHDVGHLPFSHAAEKDLLPAGWDHERLTREIVSSQEMSEIWNGMTPPLRQNDIIKLAVGPTKAKDIKFSNWEAILAEIIGGDAFGVDRIDYLLRDSYHAGVAYGRFDHYRLIDTLRILPSPLTDETGNISEQPTLGVEEGGLQSAVALLIARYFMYSQVYFHHIRRIYDIHLKDFLKAWLPGGKFSEETGKLLDITDIEVTAGIRQAATDPAKPGHDPARRLTNREHFRLLYSRNPGVDKNPESTSQIFEAALREFGEDSVRMDRHAPRGGVPDFPVKRMDDTIVSSISMSDALKHLPIEGIEYVFIDPKKRTEAEDWLRKNRDELVRLKGENP